MFINFLKDEFFKAMHHYASLQFMQIFNLKPLLLLIPLSVLRKCYFTTEFVPSKARQHYQS